MNRSFQLSAAGIDTAQSQSGQILPLSGVIVPAASAAAAPFAAGLVAPVAASFAAPIGGSILSGTSGSLSFFRNTLPYNSIAQWTHSLSKTPTDRWMDVVDGAVRGPNHRWLHHHPVDFAKAWWEQSPSTSLRWNDYVRHGFLDSITVKGLPLLPEAVHAKLVALGIPPSVLFEWTHLNIFDVAVGSLSIIGGGTHLFLAITGCLPWQGTETFLLTFGLGALQIVGGIATHNPLLIAGGALDCAAGATSYWHHIHIPEPSLIETLAPGLLGGLLSGSVITATRMFLCWNSTTPVERAVMASETMGLSALMGTMAAVSPWLSLPLAVAYSAGKFAFRVAQGSDAFWADNPLSSDLTPALCRASLHEAGGQEAVELFEGYLKRQSMMELPDEIKRHLAAIPDWSVAPSSAAHVFGSRERTGW